MFGLDIEYFEDRAFNKGYIAGMLFPITLPIGLVICSYNKLVYGYFGL